ncbi:MAG TPA: TAXI family TRAP transporter solute-binding subunit [Candidatus Binatia bacterium]|nr:TAXI family TRAP transporter solute-binding subunit [Candidatus Binatia bacterium]
MTNTRYNAKIQRAKGLLELAAATYETSLSFQTTRAAEQVLQTESRVGHELALSLIAASREGSNSVNLSFAADSFAELKGVADGKYTLAWVNPSVAPTLAYRGTGPFRKKLPLRVIATFPSYDVMGFAVHKSTGMTSLAQIAEERFPLRLSTNVTAQHALTASPTMFTVTAVMKAAGFSLADLRKWGGRIQSVSRPSHPDRREAIKKGNVNAVFDEGIKSWGQTALDSGFVYLPIEGRVLKRLSSMGYRTSVVPRSRFKGMPDDVATVDFSGWPMVVRADMPNDVVYALCEAIEKRKDFIPTDNFKPLDIGQLCANDEEAPYNVPLHPGARRFYRERGYLK